MNEAPEWFLPLMAEKGVELNEEQLRQFGLYFRLLVEWNEKMNLTGITEREAVYEKHFFDSVSLAFFVNMGKVQSIADIGSGAGFPSIPLKICFPHLKVTIVDSLNKRIQFLTHVVEQLGLQDVACVHGRAEDIARDISHRDRYDLATARAVAKLNVLNEFCLPFVKKGGSFAAMKGADPQEEIKESVRSLSELKSKVANTFHLKLPFEQSDRHIVVVDKLDGTPKKYPRKAGLPLKQPIA
ncbi:16S rRNA (guanine527-N7)-methyltransferase [Paenibacillus phyllosphaerae]|uniref:Ribosomal RNA small subunit methyltransferase G n=1 Tax=Paenibacillus phyllosphaerae TaxID=274593 RepID=A0A7W5AY49_9BACL|nr:16S rRNA (guanine(527)-N(7))-methyltransferase RsmG [Paenibacillus phyllosphaerae]MBB3110913.1 16S rRNA (guanine527-N7)-methyltransferase [Paenibacillus phyllosphaerae]